MSKRRVYRLGDLQLRIMRVLWERREGTVAEIQAALPEGKDLAYTTVATMMRKMEGRKLVTHRAEGRSFIYRATVTEDEVSHGMSEHLVEKMFAGRLTDVVSHLLSTREVSRSELALLEKLIAERKKKL